MSSYRISRDAQFSRPNSCPHQVKEDEALLLPEGLPTSTFVDDAEFTEVTDHGEVYTLFRIVRFTHEFDHHREGWTHLANVVRARNQAIGVAHLLINDRVIHEAKVVISSEQL